MTRLEILHFGYEDHRQPGAGGGSRRTHEINRRLAARHDVTVLTAGWPGAHDRVEDGVLYRHVGDGRTRLRGLRYLLALPRAARLASSDLIVEDFVAPISTIGTPDFTNIPVVASVQWLFAREKSRQYHFPFSVVESARLQKHDRFIAVSNALANEITNRRPGAHVDVVPNGVEPAAWEDMPCPAALEAGDIVFVGRLEIGQKGVDLLLRALSLMSGARLHLVGDGPDMASLRALARRLQLENRVVWHGRLSGKAKFALIQHAAVVAMPSRYETFGIVAAEALACGTPVVASDLPCLHEVLPTWFGTFVPVGEVEALADALERVRTQRVDSTTRARARIMARRFDWDALASEQEAAYLRAIDGNVNVGTVATAR